MAWLAWGQRSSSEQQCWVSWQKKHWICIKSMTMNVMELVTYNIKNISMHYPESWAGYEGVKCCFKSYLNIRPCSSQITSLKALYLFFTPGFCTLSLCCESEFHSKDYKTGRRSKSKSLLPWVSVSWWGNTMPSVSNRGCRKATTERGSTGVGSVWCKLIIHKNNHYYDLLAPLWFLNLQLQRGCSLKISNTKACSLWKNIASAWLKSAVTWWMFSLHQESGIQILCVSQSK